MSEKLTIDINAPSLGAAINPPVAREIVGGAVESVNGQTGDVVLTAQDVGALPDTTVVPTKTSDLTNDSGFVNAAGAEAAAPVQSVNGKTGAVVLNASDVGAGTYSKPSGGIPKSDLASAVQTSLGKADAAYKKPSSGIPASDLAQGVIPTVPKKTSELNNDSGFLTLDTLPIYDGGVV